MGMKYKDPTTGNFKEINVKVADTLPVGSEVDYNGTTIPTGWEEVDSPNEYSTTEKVVGTWIDGKPIYQCVLTVGSIPAGSVGHVPFSRTNIDEILDCQCFGRDSNNNWFPLSRAHPNYFKHQISIYYNYPDNEFSIEMGTEINIRKGYIVARYTKTTD